MAALLLDNAMGHNPPNPSSDSSNVSIPMLALSFEDGQKLTLGSLTFEVIFTPGHSPGHVMYYAEAEKILIGGDLIIGGAVGRTDLPDASQEQLEASIRAKLFGLPGETVVHTGHGDDTTIEAESARLN